MGSGVKLRGAIRCGPVGLEERRMGDTGFEDGGDRHAI